MVESDWEWFDCRSRKAELRYVRNLQPSRSDVKSCKSALGKVVHVIHAHVKSKGIAVERVKTCGSVGKWTASTKSSDLDLVVFINNLDAQDIERRISGILDEIEKALDDQYPGTRDVHWYRKFGLRYVIAGMEIDILIAISNVKPKDFLDVDEFQQREYMSASVSHYSTNFMKKQGPFFQDMVRVAKDWRDSYPSWPRYCKPKSYLLEVLMLHAIREHFPNLFQERSNKVNFRIFRNRYCRALLIDFFNMIGNIEPYQRGKKYNKDTISLCAFFDNYYRDEDLPWDQPEPLFRRHNARDPQRKTRYATAVVLDPSNPTNNLWLTLANANPFIRRAKATAERLEESYD